ncbi:MAG: BamA/TamA family outer membrane protein [Prolixibacteraceae bacterium]|jgi:hypothetical protein|nr:BamA/TamA family outer membrane protein [Prolixibacteraceae bacterium]
MIIKKIVLLGLLSLFVGVDLKANANVAVKDSTKNLRFSILGGPGYTPDFGPLIGGSALFTFKMDVEDTITNRSVVPVAFAFLFRGGVNLLVKPQLFLNKDKIRLFGTYSYINTMDNYYGVGYSQNKNIVRSDSTTNYSSQMVQLNPVLLFRLSQSDFFLGPVIDFRVQNITNPSNGVMVDPNYVESGGDQEGLDILTSGIGIKFNYDTRDVPANAFEGVYLDFQFIQYASLFGSDQNYNVTDIQYRQYQSLPCMGKRSVLAWMFKSSYASGDIPFTQYPSIGSPFDLRGYYKGQFRDKSATSMLLEYRHMLNINPHNFVTRMLSKVGFATWCGVGMLGPSPFEVDGLLPNYGVGLRIEVQPKMNFRMDVGRDPIIGNTLIYFNMTEAF